jgi:hypothetical protein
MIVCICARKNLNRLGFSFFSAITRSSARASSTLLIRLFGKYSACSKVLASSVTKSSQTFFPRSSRSGREQKSICQSVVSFFISLSVASFVAFDVTAVRFVDDRGCAMGVVIDRRAAAHDARGFDAVGATHAMRARVTHDMASIVRCAQALGRGNAKTRMEVARWRAVG